MKKGIILLLMLLIGIPFTGYAQEIITEEKADSIFIEPQDPIIQAVLSEADSIGVPKIKISKEAFKPNPNTATLMALVPGMGQIYNRKYWKLPIVYGAFMGCFYALIWNQNNYTDYQQAYFDIMSTNPEGNRSWADFIPGGKGMTIEQQNAYIENTNFINNHLKAGKDRFRKYRDLSIIVTVGVYAISIIDAYVDAQLFDFDITPDLTMRVEPVYTPKTSVSPSSYGVNWSLTF